MYISYCPILKVRVKVKVKVKVMHISIANIPKMMLYNQPPKLFFEASDKKGDRSSFYELDAFSKYKPVYC